MRPEAGDAGASRSAARRSRTAKQVGDYVSRELFEDILESEEEHIDWLETQLDLIERVGIQNYCQSQMADWRPRLTAQIAFEATFVASLATPSAFTDETAKYHVPADRFSTT